MLEKKEEANKHVKEDEMTSGSFSGFLIMGIDVFTLIVLLKFLWVRLALYLRILSFLSSAL